MADKKNQHFVPKVHLKNFATDGLKRKIDIWLPRHDRVVIGASIKDQCSRHYFYGKDLVVENFLNSPERIFGIVVNRIAGNRAPEADDFKILLFCWLLQQIRAEKVITEQVLMMSALREKVSLGQKGNDKLEDFLGPPMSGVEIMEMALANANKYFDVISDLRCVLLISDTRTGFVMSDNPAVSSNKLILKRHMKYRNWGFSSAGLYVYMPLTPKLGFLAIDRYVYDLIGREGRVCRINEKDVSALNQLIYIFSNNVVFLPPYENATENVETLKKVADAKPESTMRVNISVEDDEQKTQGSKRFSVASDEEFAKSTKGGLVHLESVPPIVPQHLPKLRIRQRPRVIDTESGAGLKRYGCME